jgi:hypothetical protein
MDKVITSPAGCVQIIYKNFRYRDMTIDERYEGWMRSDFKVHKVPAYDSVEVRILI